MATKVFITGATGYIGGTVFDTIATAHPEYDISVLLRNVPADFEKQYPKVKIVKGDYDSFDIISDAASKANVVVHNGNSDHEPSINALIAGLVKRDEPSYLIHLSGTGIVADWHTPTYLGKLSPKIWSDIDDLEEITSRPDGELHRNVDKIIQEAAAEHGDKLKTAIMCPPDIYGPGRGPGRTQSSHIPAEWSEIQKVGHPFYAGDGTNTKSWVHMEDLMKLYLNVVEAAAAGGEGADWGKEGYYFAATQEVSQIDISKAVGRILKAQGKIEDAEPKQLPTETVAGMMRERGVKDLGLYMFAANSRTRAHRAEKLFGYKATHPSFWDTVEADVLATLS